MHTLDGRNWNISISLGCWVALIGTWGRPDSLNPNQLSQRWMLGHWDWVQLKWLTLRRLFQIWKPQNTYLYYASKIFETIYTNVYVYARAHRHTHRHTDIPTYRPCDRQTDRPTDIQTDIQTYRHTDLQTYRHTDLQTYNDIHRHTQTYTYI